MKKINSIGFALPLLIVTLALLASGLLSYIIYLYTALHTVQIISVLLCAAGIFALAGFILLLTVELKQDKRIFQNYTKIKQQKTKVASNTFECQNCGNRMVTEKDQGCNICGITFHKPEL